MKSAQRFGILAVLALSLCAPAFAQKPQRNETPATLYGTEMEVGSTFAVDRYGRMQCLVPASATSIAKNEDAVHASGDTGVATLFVRNDGGSVLQANGDYGLPVITSTGAVAADIQIANVSSLSQGILKREDDASASADGLVAIAGVANESGASFSSTAGDYTPFGVDRSGNVNAILTKNVASGTVGNWAVRAEDSAHGDTDAGVVVFGVRETTLSSSYTAASDGDYSVPKNNEYGAQYVQIAPALDSSLSSSGITSAATNNSTNVKAGRGVIYGWSLTNTTATIKYVKLYNKATAPTCGTDTPVIRIGVPATSTVSYVNPIGINMPTGLGYCIVTGAADTDNTAVAANDIFLNLSYR